jgi:hypothetical protein
MFWPTRDANHAGILDIGLLGGAIYDADSNSWKFARESEGERTSNAMQCNASKAASSFVWVFLQLCLWNIAEEIQFLYLNVSIIS